MWILTRLPERVLRAAAGAGLLQRARRAADPERRRAQSRKDSNAYRKRTGKDAYNAVQRKRRKSDVGQLKAAVHSYYFSTLKTFGKDLAKWDETHLRTYKERLDKAYPQGFPPTDSRYDGLRARYTQLELELKRRSLRRRR